MLCPIALPRSHIPVRYGNRFSQLGVHTGIFLFHCLLLLIQGIFFCPFHAHSHGAAVIWRHIHRNEGNISDDTTLLYRSPDPPIPPIQCFAKHLLQPPAIYSINVPDQNCIENTRVRVFSQIALFPSGMASSTCHFIYISVLMHFKQCSVCLTQSSPQCAWVYKVPRTFLCHWLRQPARTFDRFLSDPHQAGMGFNLYRCHRHEFLANCHCQNIFDKSNKIRINNAQPYSLIFGSMLVQRFWHCCDFCEKCVSFSGYERCFTVDSPLGQRVVIGVIQWVEDGIAIIFLNPSWTDGRMSVFLMLSEVLELVCLSEMIYWRMVTKQWVTFGGLAYPLGFDWTQ